MSGLVLDRDTGVDGDQLSSVDSSGHTLTPDQHCLVRDNIGLVAVHLRRFGRNLAEPRRDREREDLFQEGCLGLIQAAMSYDDSSGIAFAAYALSRIHNAVSKAIHNKFTLIHLPVTRQKPTGQSERESLAGESFANRSLPSLTIHPLGDFATCSAMPACRHHPVESMCDTIGDRLRKKYHRAVDLAERELARGTSRRGDRDLLVRALREERFLIPQDEARTALRQIARQTSSSYARVAQCDKRMSRIIRRVLDSDPEFAILQQSARSHPDGIHAFMDDQLEDKIAQAGGDLFAESLREADAGRREVIFSALLDIGGSDLVGELRRRVVEMGPCARERFLGVIQ